MSSSSSSIEPRFAADLPSVLADPTLADSATRSADFIRAQLLSDGRLKATYKDGRARFEPIPDEHHDHLIDIRSGRVIEFRNEEIEAIQQVIAKRLGYTLVDHRLELYAVPLPEGTKK